MTMSPRTMKTMTVAVALGAAIAASPTPSAFAQTSSKGSDETISAQEESAFKSALKKQGVAADKVDGLVLKYMQGKTWDSMKKGSNPISKKTTTTATQLLVREVFTDGSVRS